MSEHTPTPWHADPDWREGYSWNIHIVDAANPDMRICFMTSDGPAQANADFIIKAVNNHDALVMALSGLIAFCDIKSEDETDWERAVTIARKTLAGVVGSDNR